ncbi:helix-turn-helix domain-containing protein [Massilia aquatica]|nr:helix-turn-helix transcriptional regulator [Massilia aquatica]
MDSKIAVAFGAVLRRLRTEAEMTQEQLGLEAELQRKYISLLELGEKAPSLETVLKVATGLRVDAGKLVELVCEEIQEQNLSV